MKATELQLGNWILENIDEEGFDAPCCWVTHQVTAEDFKFWLDNDWIDVSEKEFSEFWRPIPITPEILEKNGWHYNDENAKFSSETWTGGGLMLQYGSDGFMIVVTSDYDDEDTNRTPFIIKYVHQLQNAFLLTKTKINYDRRSILQP